MTDWQRERSRNGGADRIPLPRGALWLCGKPIVAAHRPMAGPEAGAQRALLEALAQR